MYSKKELSFVFKLGTGAFDDNGNNTLTLNNIKSSVRVSAYGSLMGFDAQVMLQGLSLENIAILSGKGVNQFVRKVGDLEIDILTNGNLIFNGWIYASYADMNSAPEPALILNANAGYQFHITPSQAFSAEGAVNVVDMIGAIAQTAGLAYKAWDTAGTEANPHYEGSALDQVRQICENHKLSFTVKDKVLDTWKLYKSDVKPFVSPDYGLIGYPVFQQGGLSFTTQYSPLLTGGRIVTLETSLPNASGDYLIFTSEHLLSSWDSGGRWQTSVVAMKAPDNDNRPTDNQ